MKNAKIVIVFFGIIDLFFLNRSTPAQSTEISYSEVLKMEQTALGLLRGVPHQITVTAESFPDRRKEADWKGILTREIVSPDQYREINENYTNGRWKRREYIFINGNHYQKFDDGPWQVTSPPPDYVGPVNSMSPSTATSRPLIETEAYFVETLNDKNRKVFVYETKQKSAKEVDGKETSQIITSRYLFRDDGMLLAKTSELEIVGDRKIVKNTTVYNYKNIHIEAPTINQ